MASRPQKSNKAHDDNQPAMAPLRNGQAGSSLAKTPERRRLAIEQMRENLLERLDRAAINGPLKDLLDRLFPDDAMAVYQEIAFAFFVESFVVDHDLAGRIEGLVPKSFGAKIETDAIEALAKELAMPRRFGKTTENSPAFEPLPVYTVGKVKSNGAVP